MILVISRQLQYTNTNLAELLSGASKINLPKGIGLYCDSILVSDPFTAWTIMFERTITVYSMWVTTLTLSKTIITVHTNKAK